MFARGTIALLCAFVVAAAAGSSPAWNSFRSGYEYSYEFDSQLASSLTNGDQFSATRMRALVKLNFLSDKSVLIQLERPQLGQWNDFFALPSELHKFDKFERVEIKEHNNEKLLLPFQMRLVNGKISDLQFSSDDSQSSENIKRAIVNTLQVQLENSLDKTLKTVEASTGYSFRLNETTIEGECESVYDVLPIHDDEMTVFNVTKAINFANCRERPELRFNYLRYTEPLRAQSDKAQMESVSALNVRSTYEFVVAGDKRQFIVKSGKVQSTYVYELLDSEHVKMITYSVNQMVLKNVEVKTTTPKTSTLKSSQSLIYSNELGIAMERFVAEGDESVFNMKDNKFTESMITLIKNTMTRLLEAAQETQLDEHVARYFTQLVQLLRQCRKTDLAAVYDQLFIEGDQLTKDMIVDALATAGTKKSLDLLFQMIAKKEITATKAASALTKLVNLRIVSNEMLNALEKLMKISAVSSNSHLYRTSKLVYGGMISAMCRAENPTLNAEKWALNKYCTTSVASELAKKLINDYKKASTLSEKILAIKVIGNAGLEGCQTFLENIVNDSNIEKLVRLQAIDAFRLMRNPNSNTVTTILLPIYLNIREFPEIRMNAFYQLIKAYPRQAVLDSVMASLLNEQNAHVRSFVLKMTQEMLNDARFMYDVTFAQQLESLRKELNLNADLDTYSATTFMSLMSSTPLNLREIVAQLQTAMIFGNESRMPSELMASLNLLTANRLQSDAWQFGFHAQDLEQLVEKVFSVMNGKSINDIIVRERRSSTFDVDALGVMKSLFKKMEIVARRTFSHEASPALLFYSRWNSIDLGFCLTDEESLPTLFQNFATNGKFDVSMIENIVPLSLASHSAGFTAEFMIKLPTTFGVALTTTTQVPTVSIVSGNMNVKFDANGKHIKRAVMSIKALPKLAITMLTKMEAVSSLFTSGVQNIYSAQMSLPINVKLTLNAPYWLPVIEITLPETEIRPLHLQSRPSTFTRVWPQKSNVYVEAVEKTLIVNDELQMTQIHKIEPFTGVKLNLEAHYHPNAVSDNYDWLLSGENAFELWIQGGAHTAKTLKLSIDSLVRSAFSESVINVPQFEDLVSPYQKNLFAGLTDEDELSQIKSEIQLAMRKMSKTTQIVFKASAQGATESNVAGLDLKYVCDEKNVLCVINVDANVNEDWKYRSIMQLARPILRSLAAGVPTEHILAIMDSGFGNHENVIFSMYGRPMESEIKQIRKLVNLQAMKAPVMIPARDYSIITKIKSSYMTQNDWKITMERLFNTVSALPGFNGNNNDLINENTMMNVVALRLNPLNFSIEFPGQGETRLELETSAKQTLYDLLETTPNAECAIKKGNFIKSFDGSNYKIPLTTCYTILAQDCGNPDAPRYSFMAKKMQKDQEHLKIKMYTSSNHVYEMYQDNGRMVVKVDEFILRESEYTKYNIHRIGDSNTYELRCAYANAGFRFNGVADLTLMIGSEYVGKQCGVCGHYNMDASDDLRDNANEQSTDLKEFHASFLYRGEQSCNPEALDALENGQYGFESDETSNEVEVKSTALIRTTMVIETRSKICFSKHTVATCPEGTVASNTFPRKVEYVCMRRSNLKARKTLNELMSNNNRIVQVVGNSNFAKAVNVPKICEVSAF